jgi:hypothetical protein
LTLAIIYWFPIVIFSSDSVVGLHFRGFPIINATSYALKGFTTSLTVPSRKRFASSSSDDWRWIKSYSIEADSGRDRMSLWQKHSSMAIKIFDFKSRREIQSFLKSI